MSRFLSAWYTTRLAYGFCVTTAFSCTFPPRLGARPGAAALRAQEMGKTAIMIEERTIGGTCVNRGCLPSKNLIEAARIIHEAQNPRHPGIAPATHGVDFAALIAQKEDVVRRYREKKYESLVGGNVRMVHGHAQFVDEHTVAVDGERFTAQKILIATGSRPVIPEVPGLSQVPYLTSDLLSNEDEVELKHLPNSLAIIGGGYIALELGQMFRRFGAEVTILERSSQLLARGYEPEVGSTIEEVFRNEGVRVITGAEPIAVREECGRVIVDMYQKGEQHQIYAEKLLVAAGRRPNTDRIGVEKAGVALDDTGAVRVNQYLQTTVSHIYAAGDVIGRQAGSQMATPVGSQDGGIAATNALSRNGQRAVQHRIVPRVIFTDPPVATVGMTEEEVLANGRRCWCSVVPMELVPRAGAIRDTRGFVKMVADARSGEVLGVTMVAHGAGEVIHEAAMALRFHATIADFIDQIHVYPTMAEALKIVAISRYKDPARLSCCAE